MIYNKVISNKIYFLITKNCLRSTFYNSQGFEKKEKLDKEKRKYDSFEYGNIKLKIKTDFAFDILTPSIHKPSIAVIHSFLIQHFDVACGLLMPNDSPSQRDCHIECH